MPRGKLFTKFLSVLAFAALGFIYSSGAVATHINGVKHATVLHGIDGGTTAGDGRFIWDKQCVDTVTKTLPVSCAGTTTTAAAPNIGYLFKGPDSTGRFYRTGTCWNRGTNLLVACSSATGFISSSFGHHGVKLEGGGVITLGEINPAEQLMTVIPGALGVPIQVTIDLPDVLVKGVGTNSTICGGTTLPCSLGEARSSYHVEYSIPLATLDPDDDRGGGNQKKAQTCAQKCDPQNPKFGKNCTGCVANQTCENVSTTELKFSVKAFCQQGVTVTGYLTILKGQEAPKFTNCTQPTVDAGNCTVKLGGLPDINGGLAGLLVGGVIQGTVDPVQCEAIFTPLTLNGTLLESKQLLAFEQRYSGQCADVERFGLEKPESAKFNVHRVCNSDYGNANGSFVPADPGFLGGEGFDNTQRGCIVAATSPLHVVNAQETSKSNAEVQVDITPESLNLKFSPDGQDSGVATATICGSATFNVTQIDTAKLPVLFVEGSSKVVTALGFSIAPATTGNCATDSIPDFVTTYRTSNPEGTGLAQVILDAKSDIQAGDRVEIKLQGQTSISGGSTLKNISGSDEVRVVDVP